MKKKKKENQEIEEKIVTALGFYYCEYLDPWIKMERDMKKFNNSKVKEKKNLITVGVVL